MLSGRNLTPMQFLLIITWLLLFINCTAAVYAAPAEPSALQFIPDNGSTGRGTPGSMGSTALLKILLSRLDNPSQASLDLILQKTDRVRVFAGGECKGKPITRIILLDSKDPAILAALRDALCIEEDPDSLGHDMCFGDPTIELLSGNKRLAVLGFHHARAVRFDKAWKFDAALKDGWRLVEWFAANGIKEP